MKCQACGGKGFIRREYWVEAELYHSVVDYEDCFVCKGTGQEQNNEEWFSSLSTKKKIEWIIQNGSFIVAMNQSNEPKKEWDKWLKAVHK